MSTMSLMVGGQLIAVPFGCSRRRPCEETDCVLAKEAGRCAYNENSPEAIALLNEPHDAGFNTRLVAYRARTVVEHTVGPRVLELGCGDGLVTVELSKKFPDCDAVHAVDHDATRIERAAKRIRDTFGDKRGFERVSFYTCDVMDFKGLAHSNNTIVLANLLEHVDDPVAVLERCKNWLAPDGRIVATVPNSRSLHRELGEVMKIDMPGVLTGTDTASGHKHVFNFYSLKYVYEKAGLVFLDGGGILLKPLPNAMMDTLPQSVTDGYYELGKQNRFTTMCAEIWMMFRAV